MGDSRDSQPIWAFLPCLSFLFVGSHLERAGIRSPSMGLSLRFSRHFFQGWPGSAQPTQWEVESTTPKNSYFPRAVWARARGLRNPGHDEAPGDSSHLLSRCLTHTLWKPVSNQHCFFLDLLSTSSGPVFSCPVFTGLCGQCLMMATPARDVCMRLMHRFIASHPEMRGV